MFTSRFSPALLVCTICLLALAGSAAGQGVQPAAPAAGAATPVGAAFTYQGSLHLAGVPAQGLYDFQFTLHADETGAAIGPALEIGDVFADRGIFTVQLDFGPELFAGEARWLQVAVRPGDQTGVYTVLAPRHLLTAVPYALYAPRAGWDGLAGVPAGFADGVDNDTTYSAGDGLTLDGTIFAADSTVVQRRLQSACNLGSAIRAVDDEGRVACQDFWSLLGNSGTVAGTNFLGTTDAVALSFKVNGGRALRLEPTDSTPNVIGGSSANAVTAGAEGATIAGGGLTGSNCGLGYDQPCLNTVTENFGALGGGRANTVSGYAATVGGGEQNTASSTYATAGGGLGNVASGAYSVVGGGLANTASGLQATVPGGDGNVAAGANSFAAGHNAHAYGKGTFVWADSKEANFEGSVDDQFRVRATGGAYFEAGGEQGLVARNFATGSGSTNGSALTVQGFVSRGDWYASVTVMNTGTSPAVYAETAGTYSGYFMEGIYVDGDCTGCTMAYVAVNTGGETLQIGDLVAADGVQAALSKSQKPVIAVRRAGAATAAVAGVVSGRAVLVESTKDGQTKVGAEKADGPVAPGDHLFIIVYGLAQVRADAAPGPIAAGQRLTAAASGAARSLRTVAVQGVEVAEAAPAIGTALEPLAAGKGLIWVLVTVH